MHFARVYYTCLCWYWKASLTMRNTPVRFFAEYSPCHSSKYSKLPSPETAKDSNKLLFLPSFDRNLHEHKSFRSRHVSSIWMHGCIWTRITLGLSILRCHSTWSVFRSCSTAHCGMFPKTLMLMPAQNSFERNTQVFTRYWLNRQCPPNPQRLITVTYYFLKLRCKPLYNSMSFASLLPVERWEL